MEKLKSKLIISISLLLSFSLNAQQETNDLNIQSIPITKNVSAILRTICFEGDKYILVSNSNGSDIEYLDSLECNKNGVTDYSFIFSKVIPSGTSGVVRKIDINGQNIIIYSGKNIAPTLTIQEKD
tara:strand:+ start:2843 stop:3220 length:378 start_codon:yes stop_codon:yes gene_type:complete